MYGLKPSASERLVYLKGAEVQQICIGKHDLQLRLHPDGVICIWSRCELVAADGTTADTWVDGNRSERFRFCDLLGGTISDVLVVDDKTLTLEFTDGRRLILFDTSDQHESFSVGNFIV
jgi:hypothetical protein